MHLKVTIKLKLYRKNPKWLNELSVRLIKKGVVSNIEVVENDFPRNNLLELFYNRYGKYKSSILVFTIFRLPEGFVQKSNFNEILDLTRSNSGKYFHINIDWDTWLLSRTLNKDYLLICLSYQNKILSSKMIGILNHDRVIESKIQLALHLVDLIEGYFIEGTVFKSQHNHKNIIKNSVVGLYSRFIAILRSKIFNRKWKIRFISGRNIIDLQPESNNTLWADPFLVENNNEVYCFFEEQIDKKPATIQFIEFGSTKPRIALSEEYHLSYPQIFRDKGKLYMLPEASQSESLSLYLCTEFPNRWVKIYSLFDNKKLHDATLLIHKDRYWLFAIESYDDKMNPWVDLHIYYADSLFSEWKPHSLNPVLSDVRFARCGGSFIKKGNYIFRVCQNSAGRYGRGLSFRRLVELSESTFKEEKIDNFNFPGKVSAVHTYNQLDEFRFVYDYIE